MSLAASLVSLVEAESAFQAQEKKKREKEKTKKKNVGRKTSPIENRLLLVALNLVPRPESFRLADGILGDTSLLIGFFFFF